MMGGLLLCGYGILGVFSGDFRGLYDVGFGGLAAGLCAWNLRDHANPRQGTDKPDIRSRRGRRQVLFWAAVFFLIGVLVLVNGVHRLQRDSTITGVLFALAGSCGVVLGIWGFAASLLAGRRYGNPREH
jgi:hypothetical protein